MPSERETRRQKMQELRRLGADPFRGGAVERIPIAEALKQYDEKEPRSVRIGGRIMALRDFGKAGFMHLQDWTGRMQIYIKKDVVGDAAFEIYKRLDIGDILWCEGPLQKTRTGEITVFVNRFELLTKSLMPLPEKWHGLRDPEIRHRRRYLDLIANPAAFQTMLKRSKIVMEIRKFLDARGYIEVETPVMQAIPGGAAARPFVTHHNALDMDLYLRIALEIPLKKLLVGGVERVYEIGRVFRNEGVDSSHNPEFTLLELYHAYGDLETMIELTQSLVAHLARAVVGSTKLPVGSETIDVTPPWPRREYFELLREYTGVDPHDLNVLRGRLKEKGIEMPPGASKIEVIDEAFSEYVQPHLRNPVFVVGQPIEMTPLCREDRDRPGFAHRFEAYITGMEVANAYNELTDPIVQRQRFLQQAGGAGDEMMKQGKIDEDFLRALEHGMPPAGGIGIGIDRLVMLLTNNESIREVILFPLLKHRDVAEEDITAEA